MQEVIVRRKSKRKPRSEEAKRKISESMKKRWAQLKDPNSMVSVSHTKEQVNSSSSSLTRQTVDVLDVKENNTLKNTITFLTFLDFYITHKKLIKEMLDLNNERVKKFAEDLMKIGRSYGLDLD